jgi:DNA modification methylase
MNIQKIPAEKLNPAAYNPRKDLKPGDKEYEKLKRSVSEFGIVEPIVWNERTGNIVGGHQRFKVLRDLGQTEIDCVVVDLDENREKTLNIALNKIQGEWDEAKLAELFVGFDISNYDTTLTGFDLTEVEQLLEGYYSKQCMQDDFDEEKAKKDIEESGGAFTQAGDIWLLGEHRLMCGDSTNATDFEKLMNGQKAQLCVTSPPYGVGKDYEKKGLEPWFETMRPAIKNICRNADAVIINLGDLFSTGSQFIEPTFAHCIELLGENGYRPLWIRVWDKHRQALSSSAPYHLATNKPIGDAEWLGAFAPETENNDDGLVVLDNHGYIVAAAGHNYRFVKRLSRAERKEWGFSSMWRIASVTGTANPKNRLDERNHKARFPIELPWRCQKMHSDKGNIILEPFSGSFTTAIAAEQLGRRCYAIERDPIYCDISVARFHAFAPDAEIYLLRDGETIPFSETNMCV